MSLPAVGGRRSAVSALATALVCLALLAVPLLPAVASAGWSSTPALPNAGAAPSDAPGGSDLALTAMTAPHDARLGNASAIEAARDGGRLTPTDTLAPGDRLVLRLTADGLATDLRDADGDNDTERLRSLFDGDPYDLTVRQTYDTVYVEREPKTLGLLEPDAVTVVPVGANDVYLVYDTDALGVVYGGPFDGRLYGNETTSELDPGSAYNVTIGTGNGGVTATIQVFERQIGDPLAGEAVYGVPGERGVVRLPATVAPGTEVTVELALDGQERRTVTTSVGESGFATVPLEFSNVTGEVDGTATVRDPYDGRYAEDSLRQWSTRVPVRVRSERGVVDRAEAARRSDSVRLRAGVNVSHPGFVAVRDAGGDTLHVFGPFDAGTGISANVFVERDLEPGDEVRFVAVRDVDQDGEYDADDERFGGGDPAAVVTVADARPEETTRTTTAPTPTPTTTAPTTEPTVGTTASDPTTDRSNTTGTAAADGETTTPADGDDGAVPAPGVVATVAAVLGAVALLGRRQRGE